VRTGKDELVRPSNELHSLAFCGIHVISPKIFAKMSDGAYSIIPTYLSLAAEGERITEFNADGSYWRDLGRPESIELAAQEINKWKHSNVQ
jgi:NDP-sugar pyrophosphorylase family protein